MTSQRRTGARPVVLGLLLLAVPVCADAQATASRTVVPKDPVPKEWQFIGYSFTRSTATNIAPTDDILQGQVIGKLFGRNSTSTVDRTAIYAEQRFVPYIVYRPRILDGYAVFRAMFKIDYTWGDQAYGVGGNRGGGLNTGQINLQTLMANVEIHPPDASWNLVVGEQRVFDNAYDPHAITLQQAQTSGYKLSWWGTNAVGANLFWRPVPGAHLRIGYFPLWENLIADDDDVSLFMVDYDTRLTPRLEAGVDAWYVRDRGRGAGGISVLGQGLNSALAEYNGAARMRFATEAPTYTADIAWLGGRFAWNRDFLAGRWWIDGWAMANLGTVDTVGVARAKAGDIVAFAANASVAYRYGMTAGDRILAEAIFSSGDGNSMRDGTSNAVVTGNAWGSPVGIYSAHRALLLFPDPQVVNRYYSAVHDISNGGYGVTGLSANIARDLVPNRFNARLGAATAFSNVEPTGGGVHIGSEINAEVKYNLRVFLTAGLSAAYLKLGDFYDAPAATASGTKPDDAWVAFLTLSWLMF